MARYSFRPKLWPTIFTSIMLVCLLSLGFWQVERLEWKLGLIAQIEERAFMEPVALPVDVSDLNALEYQSVIIYGFFNNAHEMTLYSVGPNGEPGYDLYTPFYTSEEETIIVNRGWVPESLKNIVDRPESLSTGQSTVTGLLRQPTSKLWYGPENEPDNNNWFYGDIQAMAIAQDLVDVYPMYLFAARTSDDNRFPIAGRTEINIVNNHFDYVLTWFGLAIVLLIIYVIAHLRKNEDQP